MMTTIILTAYNKLNYTKLAVESLLANTRDSYYELFLIDNGSTHDTYEYFQSVRNYHTHLQIIRFEENQIVEDAANMAASRATGKYLVMATNDIVFPKRWLECALTHLERTPDLGMLGVRSNSIGDPVALLPATYKTLDEFQEVAEAWSRDHHGEKFFTQRVVGMLAVMRAEAFNEVGGFDPELPTNGKDGGYGFSDDDLCIRMILNGWKLAIANDILVHHFGSVTVDRSKISAGMEINKKKFMEKLRKNPDVDISSDGRLTFSRKRI